MNRRSLVLLATLLVLIAGALWLAFNMGAPGAQRASLDRLRSDPADEWTPQAFGDALVDASQATLDEQLDALEAGSAREDVVDFQAADEPLERDELFADSPEPPEPGEYDGEIVQELYDDGTLLFDAEQSQREDGVWVVDGRWNSYHPNGQMQESGFYAMGVESGDWSWWDDNGQQIAVGNFIAGQREGVWNFWYPNGTKQMDARYTNGTGTGNWTLYYEDGSPWAQGQYLDGEISGYWTIWDEFGEVNPERSGMYEHGARISD